MANRDPQQAFGEVVRQLRLKRGISQEALADEAGLHRTYISLLERGLRNPSLTVIQQLATALGVRPAQMIAEFDALCSKRAK
ncbi:helix-turn-helix domain-containing protein [Caulifigura coniformis]|uniref:helix-turn-helix domain-containing protein n=1 Tax=Caulifigura coniformis TaxID=2527983 RepID=UPI0011A120BA|nr:helix-turn-helix transcriptional regulator [Caulifigura coniformis]